jgi:hypothetical protein
MVNSSNSERVMLQGGASKDTVMQQGGPSKDKPSETQRKRCNLKYNCLSCFLTFGPPMQVHVCDSIDDGPADRAFSVVLQETQVN